MSAQWYGCQADVFCHGPQCFYVSKEKKNTSREYRAFESWEAYVKFQIASYKKKPASLVYHELVPTWKPRRLHFDIDYQEDRRSSFNYEEVVGCLIRSCQRVLGESSITIPLTDYWVLDASRDTAEGKKWSAHVIISSVCVATHQECHEFANRVKSVMMSTIKVECYDSLSCLDMVIYQANRNLRMAYSTKLGGYYPLLHRPVEIEVNHEEVKIDHELPEDWFEAMAEVMRNTLLTVTDNCQVLAYEITTQEMTYANTTLVDSEVQAVMDLARSVFTESEFRFRLNAVHGSTIELKRTAPGPCRICMSGKNHDRLDASLFIGDTGRVIFRCWKDKSKTYYLGTMLVSGGVKYEKTKDTTNGRYLKMAEGEDIRKTSSDLIVMLLEEYGHVTRGLDLK